jgi:putative transcriptional regulator
VNKVLTLSPKSLEGQLLIATPLLRESCFERSVIYVCSHDESGAIGIIINHVFSNLDCSDIIGQQNDKALHLKLKSPVYFGGPVQSSRGFILHTNDYTGANTTTLSQNLSITSDIDTLNDIQSGKGPKKSIIALGHAGWGAGQLEAEIMSNSWLNVPANENLIFDTENQLKWDASAKMLGVNLYQYSAVAGHA